MSAERYRVTEYQHSGLDFLQIERGGSTHELCAQTDDSMIIGAIRQQSADIDSRDAVIAACAEAVGASVSPGCSDEFRAMLPGEILAALAAAVAERDEARTAYQVRSTEWHRHELIALALAERYKLRAEQAEARLAAIYGAPTIALTFCHPYSLEEPGQLIARPAKD